MVMTASAGCRVTVGKLQDDSVRLNVSFNSRISSGMIVTSTQDDGIKEFSVNVWLTAV